MSKVQIITDSCADLSSELLERYHIDYVKMSTILDGVERPALLTWTPADAHELFQTIRDGKRITTAQVTVEEFTTVFTKYLDEGCDILYLSCSVKQTGSINTGRVVAQNLMDARPGTKIICLDSYNACMGEGMLAIEAAKMAAEGADVQAIADHITAIRKTVLEFCTVHTLDYLKAAGRVSGSSAFFGNLMGVKPIIIADVNGAQAPIKKVRGRENSLKEIVKLLKENIIDPENQTVYLLHADCAQEEVDQVKAMIEQEIPCKDVYVWYIGPIIGSSVGPDAIVVYAFGKQVTFAAPED